jgi:two-component system CheB/CheR fusion protein
MPPHVNRALIVDDEPDVAEMFAVVFQQSGYEVRVVHSAQAALEAAGSEEFHVVMSDIGMPGMSGYELAAALRAMPNFRRVTLIAVTGFSVYDDRNRSQRAGFNHHLVKPVLMQKFIQLINELKNK